MVDDVVGVEDEYMSITLSLFATVCGREFEPRDLDNPAHCIVWTSFNAYGEPMCNGINMREYLFEERRRVEVPPDKVVAVRCGNWMCVHPAHCCITDARRITIPADMDNILLHSTLWGSGIRFLKMREAKSSLPRGLTLEQKMLYHTVTQGYPE